MKSRQKKQALHLLAVTAILLMWVTWSSPAEAEQMPRPDYDNSIIISFTHPLPTASVSELEYFKSQFGQGIYSKLALTNFYSVPMDWTVNPTASGNNINLFKAQIDSYITKALANKIGLHLVLAYGMARKVVDYKAAKEEDLRNAQWYNDNNIATQAQLAKASRQETWQAGQEGLHQDITAADDPQPASASQPDQPLAVNINNYVYSTPSRYARKMRNHLEAKVTAALDYLKLQQQKYPDLLLIVSAPGEAELNALRISNQSPLQTYYCDFSPFAVLEFRDWIRHEGMYGSGGKYEGEGYDAGGSRFQGTNGLANFNHDYRTNFSTWDLKYYHWSLSDALDTQYSDGHNPDPNIIPLSAYTFDGMMPASGSRYRAGGFDPPRVMKNKNEDVYYDLWNMFRETMLQHYVKDMALIARASGFSRNHYYTHQIPADYLFGTQPDDPAIPFLNPRYYCSASPMWTAGAYSDIGVGVTMYDINFGTHYARTSAYILPVLNSMADNWGALEYNPEVTIGGAAVNTVDNIYQQIMRLYNHNAHVIGFYKWENYNNSQFKGTNRETAVKQFYEAVKDNARGNITTPLTPLAVQSLNGSYKTTGAVELTWSQLIWSDLIYTWSNWGDFKNFVLYRGTTAGFSADAASEIGRVTNAFYQDTAYGPGSKFYYKVAVINSNGQRGPLADIAVTIGVGTGSPQLGVSRNNINFGAVTSGISSPMQQLFITNSGTGILNWSINSNVPWLICSPQNGTGSSIVDVTVNAAAKNVGTYNGSLTVTALGANGSPITLAVSLKIYNTGQDAKPFGVFATPLHGSTVRSSIPVTGWVLDDIGLESVKLYLKEGNSLKIIGDAVLVEGARPDVETAYPNYPGNSIAGWGYMLLTNFLPGGGNGTYEIHAVARDVTGHETNLGSKTIHVDNAHALLPFGAIDTPEQGGDASGNYVNYGWALTPMPNSIALSGSSIDIYINGVKVGHPVYNNYREDIAGLFPGYANSQGAVGYYYINTNDYEDGIYTIEWRVRDTAGNTDGVGSRYFTIRNSGGTWSGDATAAARKNQNIVWGFGHKSGIDFLSSTAHRIPRTGLKRTAVQVQRGMGNDVRVKSCGADKNGTIRIELEELETIVVYLDGEVSAYTSLPVGSTLDKKAGILTWHIGPAHLGQFTYTFVIKDQNGDCQPKHLHFKINPKTYKQNFETRFR